MPLARRAMTQKAVRAREFRKHPTPQEAHLWSLLRKARYDGVRWRRQVVILGWIVDFYCPSRSLIVELDGSYHDRIADERRDMAMASYGLRVLRFVNDAVEQRPLNVLALIQQTSVGRERFHPRRRTA